MANMNTQLACCANRALSPIQYIFLLLSTFLKTWKECQSGRSCNRPIVPGGAFVEQTNSDNLAQLFAFLLCCVEPRLGSLQFHGNVTYRDTSAERQSVAQSRRLPVVEI